MRKLISLFLLFLFVMLSPCSLAENIIRLNLQERLDVKGNQIPLDSELIEILHAVERESLIKFKPVLLPWKRAQQETSNGNGIIFGFKKTAEREQTFRFSEIVAFQRVWAFTYGVGASTINSLSDLKGQTVCTTRGVSHGYEFEQAKNNIFKVQDDTASTSARFRKLIAKRCDVMLLPIRKLISRSDVSHYVNSRFSNDLRDQPLIDGHFIPSNQPIFLESIHFASAKGHYDDVLEELNRAIIKLMRREEFRQLVSNYYFH